MQKITYFRIRKPNMVINTSDIEFTFIVKKVPYAHDVVRVMYSRKDISTTTSPTHVCDCFVDCACILYMSINTSPQDSRDFLFNSSSGELYVFESVRPLANPMGSKSVPIEFGRGRTLSIP